MEAAIHLGLDCFSMHGIAEQLGVTTPALYSHVAGRDEVLDLVRAALRTHLTTFTSSATDWRQWLTEFARLTRRQFAGSASTVLEDLRNPGVAHVGIGERGLQLLIDDGFSPADAGYAMWLVFRVAITAGPGQSTSLARFVGDTGQLLGPAVPELPATHVVHSALADEAEHDTFAFDLRIVLDGLAAQPRSAPERKPHDR